MNDSSIAVDFTLSEGDYLKMAMRKQVRQRLWIYGVAILVVFGASVWNAPPDAGAFFVGFTTVLMMLYLAVFFGAMLLLARYRLRKAFRSNKRVQEQQHVTFTAKGFTIQGSSFNNESDWTGLNRVDETPEMLLLYQSNALANMVPKHAFRSAADLTTVKGFIRATPGLKAKLD